MRILATAALVCLPFTALSSCASTPSGSPEGVATEIVAALDAGRPGDASDIFEDVSSSEAHRQKIYPLLYDAAQDRYVRGDAAGATALLRFMSKEYPNAESVKEALLYSLFLMRAGMDGPTPELTDELDETVKAVRDQGHPPLWIDLVATQTLIDQGRLNEARETLERFIGTWDGQPEAIAVYVEDIDRYLASH